MSKAQTYRDQTEEELWASYTDINKEILQLRNRSRFSANKLEQPHLIGQLRRSRARILTVLREKQLMNESMS